MTDSGGVEVSSTMQRIAGSKNNIVSSVLLLSTILFEGFVADEIFYCRCENGIWKAWVFISLTSLAVCVLALALLQTSKIHCCNGKHKERSSATVDGQIRIRSPEYSNTFDISSPKRKKADEDRWIICGCCHARSRCVDFIMTCRWLIAVFFGWFIIVLLDGDYIACGTTVDPYGDFNCSEFRSTSDLPSFSANYKYHKYISQITGYVCFAAAIAIFFILKVLPYCCSDDGRCLRFCKLLGITIEYSPDDGPRNEKRCWKSCMIFVKDSATKNTESKTETDTNAQEDRKMHGVIPNKQAVEESKQL